MGYSFRVEIRELYKSPVPLNSTIILQKQVFDENGVISSFEDHACPLWGDPNDKAAMQFIRDGLAALGDPLIGLAPLSQDQIDTIVAGHSDAWMDYANGHPVALEPTKFADFVKVAVDTQPEFADAKVAQEASRQALQDMGRGVAIEAEAVAVEKPEG